jgi:hypothetical protein
MEILRLSRSELVELKHLQIRRRRDWLATFSANEYGNIWPFVSRGWTPLENRREVRSCELIKRVRDRYLAEREGGGRIFINENGAFYKDQERQRHQFIRFQICD